MQNQEQFIVEAEDDPFADPGQPPHNPAFDHGDRRIDRPEHERAEQQHPLQRLTRDSRLERFEIDDDVRQFGHASLCGACRAAETEDA